MESTDDVPLDPTNGQCSCQWKVVELPPRRYEGKCKNNDAPLALASANTTHLVIGAWCTQGALGLQSMRVRSTKKIAVGSERLDRRNVGDWFRAMEKKGRRTSRGAQGLARASLVWDPVPRHSISRFARPGASSCLAPLSLTHSHPLFSLPRRGKSGGHIRPQFSEVTQKRTGR